MPFSRSPHTGCRPEIRFRSNQVSVLRVDLNPSRRKTTTRLDGAGLKNARNTWFFLFCGRRIRYPTELINFTRLIGTQSESLMVNVRYDTNYLRKCVFKWMPMKTIGSWFADPRFWYRHVSIVVVFFFFTSFSQFSENPYGKCNPV